VISAVSASSISSSSATISWTTNQAGDSQVEYGVTTSYGSTSAVNSSQVQQHVVLLTGLTPNTTYNFRVRSKNGAGSLSVSGNYTFKTGAASGTAVNISAEAESGVLAAPMITVSNSLARGGRYIVSNTANSGSVRFTVNIPTAGTYLLWARVLAPNANQDSFFVSVDGGAEDIYDAAEGTWLNSFQWTQINGRNGTVPLTLNPRLFTLSAGAHSITFRARETNSGLDCIIITNDRSFIPQ
jgi:hypothetical protein